MLTTCAAMAACEARIPTWVVSLAAAAWCVVIGVAPCHAQSVQLTDNATFVAVPSREAAAVPSPWPSSGLEALSAAPTGESLTMPSPEIRVQDPPEAPVVSALKYPGRLLFGFGKGLVWDPLVGLWNLGSAVVRSAQDPYDSQLSDATTALASGVAEVVAHPVAGVEGGYQTLTDTVRQGPVAQGQFVGHVAGWLLPAGGWLAKPAEALDAVAASGEGGAQASEALRTSGGAALDDPRSVDPGAPTSPTCQGPGCGVSSADGTPSCFTAGTLVDTEDGLRPIETIHVGDRVFARDEASGAVGYRNVVRTIVTHDQAVDELMIGGEAIRVTPRHRVWVVGHGWTAAEQLSDRTALQGESGETPTVSRAASLARSETVYNLEVEGFHTYFVGHVRIWVHNDCGGDALADPDQPAPGRIQPLTSSADLLNPKRERVFRLTNARVVGADYPLIKHDFGNVLMARYGKPLDQITTGEIDAWLLDSTAYIAKTQTKQTVVNTPIPHDEKQSTMALRPDDYGRALVFEPEPGVLIDAKGVGARNPKMKDHANGLATLGETIREFAYEHLINKILVHADRGDRTVGHYAIIDAGFDVKQPDGGTDPAGIILRQAHARSAGRSSLFGRQLMRKIEVTLRRYGITSAGAYQDGKFDALNIQGTPDGAIVDFGGFLAMQNFQKLAYHFDWNPDYSNHPPLLSPDGVWVQPNADVRVPYRLWGYTASGKADPQFDNPSVWSAQLATALRNGAATRADVEQHLRNLLGPVDKRLDANPVPPRPSKPNIPGPPPGAPPLESSAGN